MNDKFFCDLTEAFSLTAFIKENIKRIKAPTVIKGKLLKDHNILYRLSTPVGDASHVPFFTECPMRMSIEKRCGRYSREREFQ